jgi:hypothetical protein
VASGPLDDGQSIKDLTRNIDHVERTRTAMDTPGHPEISIGFAPQPGPQTHFVYCPYDIVVYGGARGVLPPVA